jgi:hypothetical protein
VLRREVRPHIVHTGLAGIRGMHLERWASRCASRAASVARGPLAVLGEFPAFGAVVRATTQIRELAVPVVRNPTAAAPPAGVAASPPPGREATVLRSRHLW